MKKPLLVLQAHTPLSQEVQKGIFEILKPTADRLGVEVIISDASTRIEVHHDLAPLIAAMENQTRAVAALMEQISADARRRTLPFD